MILLDKFYPKAFFISQDRDMTTFQVQCWSGGRWREPNPWPKCVQTVECQKPPTAPPAGSRNGVEDDPWISRFFIHKCQKVYKVYSLVNLRS